MKGPIVFLASLAASAALFVLLALPAYRSRGTPPAVPDTGPPDLPLRQTAERLRAAVKAPAAVLTTLEAEWGPLTERTATPPAATVELPFDRLPDLLSTLAKPGSPAPSSLRVEPLADPLRCRVRLEFGAVSPPAGNR